MANFVYNAFSGESSSSQWSKYLQDRQYLSDVTSAIKAQTKSNEAALREVSSALSSSLTASINRAAETQARSIVAVASSLDAGFANLSGDINQLNTMLDWRLSVAIDQQRISNLLLENVALLLRIPDVQKERQYHIEQGFKHYKNAALDEDLYEDALENLLEAENREKTDYVVLHRIGMIYLYSPKTLDLEKAEAYFRRAAKYAVVESDAHGQQAFSILAGQVSAKLSEQSVTPDAIKTIAADSFLQAGIACYAQGKFHDAFELSSKAYSLIPTALEAGFLKAKSLAATGSEIEAAQTASDIIKADRIYALRTATDGDLGSRSAVQHMLLQLRDAAVAQARERIESLRPAITSDSAAAQFFVELERLVEQNTYLDALAVLDGLGKRNWKAPFLWGVCKPKLVEAIQDTSSATGIQFDSDGRLVTAKADPHHFVGLGSVVSPDGRFVAVPGQQSILIRDPATGDFISRLKTATDRVKQLAFLDGTDLVVTLAHDGQRVQLWRVWTGELIKLDVSYPVSTFAFNPDFTKLGLRYSYRLEVWTTEDLTLEELITLEAAEKRKAMEKEAAVRKRLATARELLRQAQLEEEKQNSKRFLKNYGEAIRLYKKAAALGSTKANDRAEALLKAFGDKLSF